MKKKIRVLVTCLLLVLVVTACGSASYDKAMTEAVTNGYAYEYGAVTEEKDVWMESDTLLAGGTANSSGSYKSDSGQEILTGEKLVYTCDLTIQTLDYENCVQTIKDNINTYKGIIESETENDEAYRWYYEDYVKKSGTRYLYLEVRIPSGKYYEFLDTLEGNGKIVSKSSFVENISKQYYETDAMIQSLEIQQDRLLEMMQKAYDIEDMITIESRLSEVQYQLSLYKNQLASMDSDVEYSTIKINVEEVMEYKQDEPMVKTNTFLDRLKNTFAETWEFFLEMLEGMLFFAIRMLPIALVVGVIAFVIRLIIVTDKKKRLRKMQDMQQAQAAALQNDFQNPSQQ